MRWSGDEGSAVELGRERPAPGRQQLGSHVWRPGMDGRSPETQRDLTGLFSLQCLDVVLEERRNSPPVRSVVLVGGTGQLGRRCRVRDRRCPCSRRPSPGQRSRSAPGRRTDGLCGASVLPRIPPSSGV